MNKDFLEKSKILRTNIMVMETDMIALSAERESMNKVLIKLSNIKNDLEYNVDLHRQIGTIPVLSEYKKTLNELEVVKSNIVDWDRKLRNVESKIEFVEKKLAFLRIEQESLFLQIRQDKVILLFRNENGRKDIK